MSYDVHVKLDAPSQSFDVGRIAAAVGLAMSDHESMNEVVIQEIWVERADV